MIKTGKEKTLETKIEDWLVNQVKQLGGIADKFVSPANPGVPDRLIIMPNGRIYFVELKATWGRLSNIQKWQRERYKNLGADVRVIKGMEQAKEFVKELRHGI
jgi:hypothetical protein